jgi:hypothetical protein
MRITCGCTHLGDAAPECAHRLTRNRQLVERGIDNGQLGVIKLPRA